MENNELGYVKVKLLELEKKTKTNRIYSGKAVEEYVNTINDIIGDGVIFFYGKEQSESVENMCINEDLNITYQGYVNELYKLFTTLHGGFNKELLVKRMFIEDGYLYANLKVLNYTFESDEDMSNAIGKHITAKTSSISVVDGIEIPNDIFFIELFLDLDRIPKEKYTFLNPTRYINYPIPLEVFKEMEELYSIDISDLQDDSIKKEE